MMLNYVIILYDKPKPKMQIVREIAGELPITLVVSYFFVIADILL